MTRILLTSLKINESQWIDAPNLSEEKNKMPSDSLGLLLSSVAKICNITKLGGTELHIERDQVFISHLVKLADC